jgi:hypothetical protein
MTKILALDLAALALPTNWQKSTLPPTEWNSLANFLDSNQTTSCGKRRTNFLVRLALVQNQTAPR